MPRARELRLPEARLVGLVPDDEVLDGRVSARQERHVLRVENRCVRILGDRLRLRGGHREDRANTAKSGERDVEIELPLVRDRGRRGGIETDRDPVLGHPELAQAVEEPDALVWVPAEVVGNAGAQRSRRATGERERGNEQGKEDGEALHSPSAAPSSAPRVHHRVLCGCSITAHGGSVPAQAPHRCLTIWRMRTCETPAAAAI